MTAPRTASDDLASFYDGPIPPADIAAARWGQRAFDRVARAAASAGMEARVRAVLAALRRSAKCGAAGVANRRLEGLAADYRRRALAAVSAG